MHSFQFFTLFCVVFVTLAGLFGVSRYASGVRLQLNKRHWKMICDSQPPALLLLFLVFCCSVPFSFDCQSGMGKNGLWVTLVGTSFWVLVGKGALDKWWCASHDCLPLRVTPPSDTLGKSQMTAVLNEKCQPDVKDTFFLFLHFTPFCVCFADFIVYIITANRHAWKQSTS